MANEEPCPDELLNWHEAYDLYSANEETIKTKAQQTKQTRNNFYQAIIRWKTIPDKPYARARKWAQIVSKAGIAGDLMTLGNDLFVVQMHTTLLNLSEDDGDIMSLASSLWSCATERATALAQRDELTNNVRAAKKIYDKCINQIPADSDTPSEPEQPDDTSSDEQGSLPPVLDSRRCLAARTGHGHVGEPCQTILGEDGICQYHGPRWNVA